MTDKKFENHCKRKCPRSFTSRIFLSKLSLGCNEAVLFVIKTMITLMFSNSLGNLPADYHNHILVLHLQYLHLRQTDSGSLMVRKSSRHIEGYSDSSVDSLEMLTLHLVGLIHLHN